MMIHRLIALSMLTAMTVPTGAARAQGAFPAPLPGQGAPTTGGQALAPVPTSPCSQDFIPLREDAEKKSKMIKAASDRHASPEEACRLIGDYSATEVKMIKYVEANAARCGIPTSVLEQLKAGHRNTKGLESKVCTVAAQARKQGVPGQINDFSDPAFERYRF